MSRKYMSMKGSFNIILFLVVLFTISTFNIASLESSQSGITSKTYQSVNNPFNSWNYSKEIQINPKTPVNNYQIKIELNSSNFMYNHANKDGSDLRFTDLNNYSLNYWIEQWQYGGNSTIWVKVTNAGTSSILMYYGNGLAQDQSDGVKTFLFFENFTGNTLNQSKWQIDSDQYSILNVSSGFVNLTSTAPNPYFQYLAIGFDNLTLEHGQTYGNMVDTSVMLRDSQLIIHNADKTTFSNLSVPAHKWITGEVQWINSTFVQFEDRNNNNISQLTANMPQTELPVSLSVSGIIAGVGTWYGIVLKSNFVAGEGTAVGFNCYQNTTYNSNEYPNLITNWIYVRELGQTYQNSNISNPTTSQSITSSGSQQTSQSSTNPSNITLHTTPSFEVSGLLVFLCCLYVFRKRR